MITQTRKRNFFASGESVRKKLSVGTHGAQINRQTELFVGDLQFGCT